MLALRLGFRLHRMHEMQTIVTDLRGVRLSVCHAAHLGFTERGLFGAAFAQSLWPLVICSCIGAVFSLLPTLVGV